MKLFQLGKILKKHIKSSQFAIYKYIANELLASVNSSLANFNINLIIQTVTLNVFATSSQRANYRSSLGSKLANFFKIM